MMQIPFNGGYIHVVSHFPVKETIDLVVELFTADMGLQGSELLVLFHFPNEEGNQLTWQEYVKLHPSLPLGWLIASYGVQNEFWRWYNQIRQGSIDNPIIVDHRDL